MSKPTARSEDSNRNAPEFEAEREFVEQVDRVCSLGASGRLEDALQVAQSARAFMDRVALSEAASVAAALRNLGVFYFKSGYTRLALGAYERSMAAAQRLQPVDEELLASLYNNLGQAWQQTARLQEAQDALETAVVMRRRNSPAERVLGYALDNLNSVLAQQGSLDRAEALGLEALEIFEQLGGPFDSDLATCLGNLSKIYIRKGDFQRAEACRLRALDSHERKLGIFHPSTINDLANLADLYRECGESERADSFLNLLLTLGADKPSPNHRNLADGLSGLAKNAFADFRLDWAERCGTRAAELLEALEGPGAPETLHAFHLLGNVHRSMGNIGPAEKNLQRARAGFEALQMPKEAISALVDLGKVYRETNSAEVAQQVFRSSVAHLRQQSKSDRQGIASALGNLGLALMDAGRNAEADAALSEALRELDTGEVEYGERPWLVHCQGLLKYHIGDYESAVGFYETAKQLWTESEGADHPFVATAAANIALVHWSSGNSEKTVDSFAEAEHIRDREMQRILAVGSEQKRASYARNLQADLFKVVTFCLGLNPIPERVARFAAQVTLRRKGRVLDAVAQTFSRLRDSADPRDREALDRLRSVREKMAALVASSLVSRRRSGNRKELEALRVEEEALEAKVSYRGAMVDPDLESVTLEAVQDCLPRDGALLEFLRYSQFDTVRTGVMETWSGERFAAFVLLPAGGPQWFDLGPAAEIEALVDAWRSLLRNRNSDDEQRNGLAETLYQRLIAPIEDLLEDRCHLFVSGDGKLVLVPFGELRSAGGAALSKRLVVSYLTSGRDVSRVQSIVPRADKVVIFAAPNFKAPLKSGQSVGSHALRFVGRGRFAPLPGTEQEGREIAQMFPDARLLLDKDATAEAFCEVERPLVLHVATHGIFSPWDESSLRNDVNVMGVGDDVMIVQQLKEASFTNPMFFSGLALSGAELDGAGIVLAQQIAGMDLKGTQLVVLSACETGLGAVKHGEEFSGMRRALAIAGAVTQVTSLWKVDDAATRVLMSSYYRLLLEGKGRAEALQEAQRVVANDALHPEWKHPAYWAAFVSAGGWEALPGVPEADSKRGGYEDER